MKHVITGKDHIVGPWVAERIGGGWSPSRGVTIGLFDSEHDRLCAGAIYNDCNGASVVAHLAGTGRDWLNREFLWFNFFYVFEQLKVNKLIAPVESGNSACIRFCKHIGYELEATLSDASPSGDLLIFTMTREQCKWLELKGRYRGKAHSPNTA